MLTAITCTGSRPEAIKLCAYYMKRQTYKGPIQWIVITDDVYPEYLKEVLTGLPENITPELYLGPEHWKFGLNTYAPNMLTALENVKGDKVVIFEDDDWYSPTYIEKMEKFLGLVEIAGEVNSSYYNLTLPGWRRMRNYAHASLCQTAFQVSLLPVFESAVKSGNKFFDVEFWNAIHKRGIPSLMVADSNICIGMKNMPGRPGIGVGHKKEGYLEDTYLDVLKRWLPEDHKFYLPFAKGLQHGQKNATAQTSQPKRGSKKDAQIKGQTEVEAGRGFQAR